MLILTACCFGRLNVSNFVQPDGCQSDYKCVEWQSIFKSGKQNINHEKVFVYGCVHIVYLSFDKKHPYRMRRKHRLTSLLFHYTLNM